MKWILSLLVVVSFGAEAQCFSVGGRVRCEADNLYEGNTPVIIDSRGNYRGNLNGNRYDLNSISNPDGLYGNEQSLESINNPYSNEFNELFTGE